MELKRELLEIKKKELIENHKQLTKDVNDKTIALYQIGGAIEILNILLKETEPELVMTE